MANNLQGGDIAFADYNQAGKMGEVDSVRGRLSRRIADGGLAFDNL
ncbi:MAG: hypothetical protein ACTH8B_19610 [Serratia proteamaculans]